MATYCIMLCMHRRQTAVPQRCSMSAKLRAKQATMEANANANPAKAACLPWLLAMAKCLT